MSTLAASPAPTLDDILRLFSETDRKFQETDRKIQETDRMLKERAVETDLMVKALSTNLGNIGNRMGEFVQHMVEPTVVKLFRSQGMKSTRCIPMCKLSAVEKAWRWICWWSTMVHWWLWNVKAS